MRDGHARSVMNEDIAKDSTYSLRRQLHAQDLAGSNHRRPSKQADLAPKSSQANVVLIDGGLLSQSQAKYCDICARQFHGGALMVGQMRCCSIQCSIVARSLERAPTTRNANATHELELGRKVRGLLEFSAAAYHTRPR